VQDYVHTTAERTTVTGRATMVILACGEASGTSQYSRNPKLEKDHDVTAKFSYYTSSVPFHARYTTHTHTHTHHAVSPLTVSITSLSSFTDGPVQ
jgi:hypothetical protein